MMLARVWLETGVREKLRTCFRNNIHHHPTLPQWEAGNCTFSRLDSKSAQIKTDRGFNSVATRLSSTQLSEASLLSDHRQTKSLRNLEETQ